VTDTTVDLKEEIRALKPARCEPGILSGSAEPDARMFWIPERLAPLYGTPSYELLSVEQRLGYNHYYAVYIAEQFIWLETFFIVNPIQQLLARGRIPDLYRSVLQSLLADEKSHHAVFWKLLKMARPDLYGEPGFRLFSVPAKVDWTARLMSRFPRLLSSWVLAANFFEERSILVHREYEKAGDQVDPVFSRVHALHAQDEARHCSLDRRLADWLIEGQGKAASLVNGWFLALALGTYLDPRWGHDSPIRALVRDHPALEARLPLFLDNVAQERGTEYQRMLFDRAAAPITDRNRRRFPIFDAAIRRLR
jgi:hypothetical protein